MDRRQCDWKRLVVNDDYKAMLQSEAREKKRQAALAVLREAESIRTVDYANGILDQMDWEEKLVEREAKRQLEKLAEQEPKVINDRFPLRWNS